MGYDIGLLLDGIILVFLCVTIFYAARLSLFMKSFREGRSEMHRLIRDLSTTIDKAEGAISVMKDHAKGTELELRTIINEAKFLSDELRFMNETGDSLADRLERLADRNRELVDLMEKSGGIGTQRIMPYEPGAAKATYSNAQRGQVEADADFDIDDFEIDEDDEFDFKALSDGAYREDEDPEDFVEEIINNQQSAHQSKINTDAKSKVRSFAIFDRDYDDDEVMDDVQDVAPVQKKGEKRFHSKAEQDLYEALQRKKNVYDKEKTAVKGVNKIS